MKDFDGELVCLQLRPIRNRYCHGNGRGYRRGRVMDALHLSRTVLEWAADQIGSSVHELARKVSKRKSDRIAVGEVTTAQAIKIAHLAGVPFGYLFLQEPPAPRKLRIADFRTLPQAAPLGKNYFDVFDDIELKQAWYREYLQSTGVGDRAYVGKFASKSADPKQVADDIRDTIRFTKEDRSRTANPEDLFWSLAAKAERIGVLVFKNGIVGNNTKRPIAVREFRGFCISDPLAPAIFVNGSDWPAAWVFTLVHELAHIWRGESGVSDAFPESTNDNELFCNAVAAEFLVPQAEFTVLWNNARGDTAARINAGRQHFKVSKLALYIRAFHLHFIEYAEYERAKDAAAHYPRKRETGGGDFYRNLAVRNSKMLSQQIASLAMSGEISMREAGRLLNTNPNHVAAFHARQK